MSRITSVKVISDQKMSVALELTPKEFLWLKGNIDKMHLFSEENLEYESKIVQRGKKESSKYFLMPKDLRKDLLPNTLAQCNRIETKTRNIFIFAVDKY
jgi:hypothetical protein